MSSGRAKRSTQSDLPWLPGISFISICVFHRPLVPLSLCRFRKLGWRNWACFLSCVRQHVSGSAAIAATTYSILPTLRLLQISMVLLIEGQLRCPWSRWRGELGLGKDLLHCIGPCLKLVIHLIQVLKPNTVGHHLERVQVTLLNHLQELVPVLVDGSLAVSN